MGARLVAGLLRSRLGGEGVPRRSIESPSGNRGWGGSGTKEHFPRRSISIDPRKAAIARHAASTPPPIRGLSPAIHALALLLLLAGSTSSPANGTCINLFNGNTLDGWTPLGPARFEAVDGVIRGTPVDSEANSFLATNEEFGDFELHLQFRYEAGMFNSGVQFRSNRYERETPIRFRSGDKRMIEATAQPGRVYGYQAEIDPSARAWSAEIYDADLNTWSTTQSLDGWRFAHSLTTLDDGNVIANFAQNCGNPRSLFRVIFRMDTPVEQRKLDLSHHAKPTLKHPRSLKFLDEFLG